MFNSLCGLSNVSLGGSATGLFSGRDENLVKLIIYPHWVYFVKAACRWKWRFRSRVKFMKELVAHIEKLFNTLKRVVNYDMFGGLRIKARFTGVDSLVALRNWILVNDFFSLPLLSFRTQLHFQLNYFIRFLQKRSSRILKVLLCFRLSLGCFVVTTENE